MNLRSHDSYSLFALVFNILIKAEHTGLVDDRMYARGLIDIPLEYDEASERYFDRLRSNRASAPASYSSVDLGYVTEVTTKRWARCDLI